VKRQTILAGATIMMVATILSRLLGFVRDAAMGHFWGGNTPHTDAFWAAFGVPDLLYYVLSGGALSAAIIPVFAGYLHRAEHADSWRVANTLLTLFALCAAGGAILIVIFARALVLLVAPGFARDPAKATECALYVRLLAPMVIFTVSSGLATGFLQAHRHFTAPAAAWAVYNFGIIGGAFVGGLMVSRYAGDPIGLRAPALGVLVGAVLLLVVQAPALRALGFRLRPALELSHPGVRETLRLFLPYMLGLAAAQICLLWLPSFFGSYFEGGVTSLRYANRLVILPLGLFGIAISTAAFPTMADQVAAGQIAEFRRLVSNSLRAVFFLAIPSAVGLAVLAGPILRLLWKSGRFDETAVAMSSFSLVFFVGALVGLSGLQILNRAFFSLKDRRTPPLVAIGYNIVVVLVALLAMRTPLKYAGVAAAISVGALLGLLVMIQLLRRRIGGVDGRQIALSTLRMLLASAALAAAAGLVMQWSGRALQVPASHFMLAAPTPAAALPNIATPKSAVGLQVLLSMSAGAAAYLVVLRLLGAPEIESFRAVLRRRRGARSLESLPVE